MSLTDEWLDIVREVVTNPGEFFAEENRRDGFGFPFKFAALSLTVAGVLTAVRSALFQTVLSDLGGTAAASFTAMGAVTSLIGTVIGGLIGLIIGAGIAHIFVALLGGEEGYGNTLAAFSYATALSPITALLAFIPLIGGLANLILGIYGVYIQIKGVEKFQSMTTGQAALAVLLPAIIVIGLALGLILMAGAAALSSIAGLGALGA